ncbi:MAG: trypsin-like peptidase domain-containing protein [Bdellovibrionales bacterium]|nr:trypsin-like peptidase domain-containing protein [Bdellovibrionales bacterium]
MERTAYSRALISGIFAASIGLVGCGKQTPTVEPLAYNADLYSSYGEASKIIGSNNMVPVKADGSNIDSNLRKYLDAFGIISIGNSGACSGTHIGNGYVLTAGHCFFDENTSGTRIAQNKACTNIKVYWGYRGSPETGSPKPVVSGVAQCTKLIYAEQTQQRDFAIFKVDKAPSVTIGLALESGRTAVGTKLTIFGYPQGRPLEWSQYCALQSSTAAGLNAIKGQSTFIYTCDTEPGNSGSSILAFSSNGVPKVIGVHDGAAPSGIDFNYATYMYDARSVLKSKGFDISRAVMTNGI